MRSTKKGICCKHADLWPSLSRSLLRTANNPHPMFFFVPCRCPRYVAMIRDELSLATDHLEEVEIGMSGWLSKWRDRDVYLWGSVK